MTGNKKKINYKLDFKKMFLTRIIPSFLQDKMCTMILFKIQVLHNV